MRSEYRLGRQWQPCQIHLAWYGTPHRHLIEYPMLLLGFFHACASCSLALKPVVSRPILNFANDCTGTRGTLVGRTPCNTPMIQTHVIVIFGNVFPFLVQHLPCRTKFFILLSQAIDNDRQCHGGILEAKVKHFIPIVPVDSPDCVFVYHSQDTSIEGILINLSTKTGTGDA